MTQTYHGLSLDALNQYINVLLCNTEGNENIQVKNLPERKWLSVGYYDAVGWQVKMNYFN